MSEPQRITPAENPALALVELELKRALDRKAKPHLESLLGAVRYRTELSVTLCTGDDAVEFQTDVLEVAYHLTLDKDAFSDEDGTLWDRVTDTFYGYVEEVGAICDMYLVRDICNGIELDGFVGRDLDGFRQPNFGQSVTTVSAAIFDEMEDALPIPVAIADCPEDFARPDWDTVNAEDPEEVVRHIIAVFASHHDLSPIDPGRIKGSDTLFALMGGDDAMTRGCVRSILIHVNVVASYPAHTLITVQCAVRVIGEIMIDQKTSIHDRLVGHGILDLNEGESLEFLGRGMVNVKCVSVEEGPDGVVKTFEVVFQVDSSPVVTYCIAPDGSHSVLKYEDMGGYTAFEQSPYYAEMCSDLE